VLIYAPLRQDPIAFHARRLVPEQDQHNPALVKIHPNGRLNGDARNVRLGMSGVNQTCPSPLDLAGRYAQASKSVTANLDPDERTWNLKVALITVSSLCSAGFMRRLCVKTGQNVKV
jgi:hypothetical protein